MPAISTRTSPGPGSSSVTDSIENGCPTARRTAAVIFIVHLSAVTSVTVIQMVIQTTIVRKWPTAFMSRGTLAGTWSPRKRVPAGPATRPSTGASSTRR
ncbi:hypothetical protein FRACA_10083 [Frankia canadensis]|uniref:Uncharacterized protein n=1 Tax=Frankia canadensis TaxID=1836972 RepID=A0A2I2KI38_9ACTN|nr:hypothetical protein FRACA_10083 [Frankia canadensis]SOU52614.1 hypothetical protein FRACA_10083 [Frankia canadensis]